MRELERQFVQRCTYVGLDVALSMRLFTHLDTAKTRDKCIRAIESWLIRRMLTGCNAGGYDGLFRDLIAQLAQIPGEDPYGPIASRLQRFGTWPARPCVQWHVKSTPISKRRSRKTRMILEGIDSFLNAKSEDADSRVVPGSLEIEHVMPLKWREREKDWPLDGKGASEGDERDKVIWTLGNLTLLPPELNSKISNQSWECKRERLRDEYDSLPRLTKCLLDDYGKREWNECSIRERGLKLGECINEIWPDARHF